MNKTKPYLRSLFYQVFQENWVKSGS